MATTRPRHEVEKEIEDTLGLVPAFMARIPDELLDYEWTLFRRFEMEPTSPSESAPLIPPKYRQLIGVALHAGTRCPYCILFHTELARFFGASDEEIQAAVHFAKHSVSWSTYLNGVRTDYDQFTDELYKVCEHLQKQEQREDEQTRS